MKPDIPKEVREHLDRMVEYLMDAEGRHYEEAEQDERENHIYRSVLAVARWMRGYNDHE